MKKGMMSKKLSLSLLVVLVLTLLLAACAGAGGEQPSATPAPGGNNAPAEEVVVENIDVLTLESFPVQIHAVVRGQLPDACAFVEEVSQRREGNTFHVTLQIARQANARCAPAATPFEHTIPLDVVGLAAGSYTVEVHGATATFDLAVDNG